MPGVRQSRNSSMSSSIFSGEYARKSFGDGLRMSVQGNQNIGGEREKLLWIVGADVRRLGVG